MLLLAGDVSGLIGLFKETGSMIIGVGFICAGLGVIKRAITNPEKLKESIITYLVALIVYITIWSLI